MEPQLAPERRRAFFAVMLLLPLILLGLLEVGLRAGGFGDALPLWVEADAHGDWLTMNPRVSERWFFGDVDAPGATFDPFRAERRPETFRVVVQGGSTALGFPYFYGGAFPRMLEDRLRRAFPDRDIEVINTALTAVNSHTLRDMGREIVQIDPDVVLIYAGHNEFYGALGVASTVSGGGALAVRAWLATRDFRIMQLLSAARETLAGSRPGEPAGEGAGATTMARMVAEQRIPLDSELYGAGEAQLRGNMGALLERYRRAGIPVLVGTLVSNEHDQAPFISGPPAEGVDWDEIQRVAELALVGGNPEAARAQLAGLTDRDRSNAEGFFRLAQTFDAAGESGTARELYRAARDRDQLRFRAPTGFTDLMRDLAARHGAHIVETEAAFRSNSPDGIIGGSLITEHLHPNLTGYHLLANAFYEGMVEAGVLPGKAQAGGDAEYARSAIPATPVDSTYGAILIESLTAGWPFQNDPALEQTLVDALYAREPRSREEELGRAVFVGQMDWAEAQGRLLTSYEAGEQWEDARRVARALALEQALSPMAAARAGSLELRAGGRRAALDWFEEAAALAPRGDPMASAILQAARDLGSLEAAVERDPSSDNLYRLAAAWALLNIPDYAVATLERLLETDPENERANDLRETLVGLPH